MDLHLKDKVALITGASSGIGAGTAELFAKHGAKLAITGRNQANLEQTTKKCTAQGVQVKAIVADLAEDADVKRVVEETIAEFGSLDILVNSAGIVKVGSIETTSMEQYDQVMNVNLRSVYHLTMLCVPHLVKTKGSIVNVSSINGLRSFPGVLAYCMSKSAIDQMTSCVALELASKEVRVNSVNPGVIITEIHKRGGMGDEAYQKFLEHSKTTHAMGRVGDVEEVANAIAFLASDKASFTTGVHLPVDGGRGSMCPR